MRTVLLSCITIALGLVLMFALITVLSFINVRYDKALHFMGGAFLSFGLFYVLRKNFPLFNNQFLMFVLLVTSSITIGVVWEFVEFFYDRTLHYSLHTTPSQPSLLDTLGDLLADSGGALLASLYLVTKKLR